MVKVSHFLSFFFFFSFLSFFFSFASSSSSSTSTLPPLSLSFFLLFLSFLLSLSSASSTSSLLPLPFSFYFYSLSAASSSSSIACVCFRLSPIYLSRYAVYVKMSCSCIWRSIISVKMIWKASFRPLSCRYLSNLSMWPCRSSLVSSSITSSFSGYGS